MATRCTPPLMWNSPVFPLLPIGTACRHTTITRRLCAAGLNLQHIQRCVRVSWVIHFVLLIQSLVFRVHIPLLQLTRVASQLQAQCDLILKNTVKFSGAGTCPSLPGDICGGLTLGTAGEFRIIERVDDIDWLQILHLRADVVRSRSFLDVQVRWQDEPRAKERDV